MDGSHPAVALTDPGNVQFCNYQDDVATLVIDDNGNVVWRSPAAATLMTGESPIIERFGRITGADRRAQKCLSDNMAKAWAGESVCQFVDSDLEKSFLLRVRSMIAEGVQALVVTIRDFDAPPSLPRFGVLFGLSAMESSILDDIVEGKSAERIAEGRGVSILTVRTHIKHMYGKMGVRSKEEVLAKIVRVVA